MVIISPMFIIVIKLYFTRKKNKICGNLYHIFTIDFCNAISFVNFSAWSIRGES